MPGDARIAAWDDVECPKCGAMNASARQHHIVLVADERGRHYECSVCGASFDVKERTE